MLREKSKIRGTRGASGRVKVLNQVVRLGLTKKVTSDQTLDKGEE